MAFARHSVTDERWHTAWNFLAPVLDLGWTSLDVVKIQQLMIPSAPKGLQRITQMYTSGHLFKTIERVSIKKKNSDQDDRMIIRWQMQPLTNWWRQPQGRNAHDLGTCYKFRPRNVRDYWPCRDELSFLIPSTQSPYFRGLALIYNLEDTFCSLGSKGCLSNASHHDVKYFRDNCSLCQETEPDQPREIIKQNLAHRNGKIVDFISLIQSMWRKKFTSLFYLKSVITCGMRNSKSLLRVKDVITHPFHIALKEMVW